ncbi:MAG: hypothetical protein HKO53_09690 [Gemmatimonadetes bacterium]|nr:hypothetical protein [Gemmatimonadota bacterium]NNM33327.1 hypothetical protein [Gemmatimonadota bacterium]
MPRFWKGIGFLCAVGALLVSAACRSVLETEARMFRHFGEARQVNGAALFGRLDVAKAAALRIERAGPVPGVPAGSEAYSHAVQAEARAITTLADRAALPIRSAALAEACGACHGALERGPRFAAGQRPPDPGMQGHMRLHAWAAERLWEGVVSRDASIWAAGAAALDNEPLPPEDFRTSVGDVDTAFLISSRAHLLAGQAVRAVDWPTRTDLLARVTETCYQCHDLIGAGS